MREATRNLAVGLTALIGVVGLMLMILLFGNVQQWIQRGYPLTITVPEAAGLTNGSEVLLSGIRVGHVENVYFQQPAGTGVVLECRIRGDVRIPEQVQASVHTELFAGTSRLSLQVRDVPHEHLRYLPDDGSAVISGDVPTIATAVTAELHSAMEEPLEQLRTITAEFSALSQEWTRVGSNVNRMLGAPGEADDADAEAGDALTGNLPRLLAQAERRLVEMERVIAGIDRYVNDDELYENVVGTVANARQVSDQVAGRVDALGDAMEASVAELRERYVALADDLGGAIASVRQLTDDARVGEGTLARLMQDPQLYENLNDSAVRMQAAVDDLRLLIQKWEAEGMPLRFF